MALTPTQRTTVLAAVKADPTAEGLRAGGSVTGLLAWLNGPSATLAWQAACVAKTLDEGANYTAFDAVAAGKRDAWALFLMYAPRDLGRNKNRNLVTDVWGTATASSVAESILLAGTETATRAQNVLGGTSKATGTVTALDRAFSGLCDESDAQWLVQQP